MAYANGQFPKSATTALASAPGQRLEATAARQWDALAWSVQHTYGWLPVLTDSYRPYSVQERIFRERYRVQWSGSGPFGDVRYWQGVRWVRVSGAAAAVPGTSNHGWGKAVDCSGLGGFNGTRFKQLAYLAARFGFSNREGRSVGEAWHWVFTGSYQVSNPIGGSGAVTDPNIPGAPSPITPEEDVPLDNTDLNKILNAEFEIEQGGKKRKVRLVDALSAVYFYGDRLNSEVKATPARTWAVAMEHPVSGENTRAADFLRYTAKEGVVTRDAVVAGTSRAVAETSAAYHQTLKALTAVKSGTSDVDVAALAAALKAELPAAVADELADRLKG